jgi:putative hydrolase of the HAD superfamily
MSVSRGRRLRVLALDLGGVVYRSWPDQPFIQRWSGRFGVSPEELTECLWRQPQWPLAEIGEITPDECHARTAARLGVAPVLVRALVTEAFASDPDEALASYVAGVRRREVVVAALTNNMSCESELLARPELARLFDLAISSADARLAKPDAGFYRHAETRLSAAGEEVIFLDDTLANIEAARSLGWRAIHYKSTAQSIEEIEAALCEVR